KYRAAGMKEIDIVGTLKPGITGLPRSLYMTKNGRLVAQKWRTLALVMHSLSSAAMGIGLNRNTRVLFVC
ncbi:MAG: hypothetical protein VYA01_05810, partial [Bacteroidota bacterium]|nr:hypothetical protein [Bacteroidota bacterium]